MNQQTINELLGTPDITTFLVYLFFTVLGAILSVLFEVSSRDKDSLSTPYRFDLLFLLQNNVVRFAITAILIYLSIRFSEQLNGGPASAWNCIMAGLSLDKIAEFLKHKKVIPSEGKR